MHEDNLSLSIYPNGDVTLIGTARKYSKKSFKRKLPLTQKKKVNRCFDIIRCEYVKGSIQCVVIDVEGVESVVVLADDHLIFGNYHLYQDKSIKQMTMEKHVRKSVQELTRCCKKSDSDVAAEFENPSSLNAPNKLTVSELTQFQRNSDTIGDKMFKRVMTPSTDADSLDAASEFSSGVTNATR